MTVVLDGCPGFRAVPFDIAECREYRKFIAKVSRQGKAEHGRGWLMDSNDQGYLLSGKQRWKGGKTPKNSQI